MTVRFYLLPIEQAGIYRGPKYLKWRFGNGLSGQWSLKDFGNATDIGLVAYDGIISQTDVLELGQVWTAKQRDAVAAYLTNSGIETPWITGAPDWREGLHRVAGMALSHQGGQDNPDKWLGRPVYCGPVGLNPIDWQAFEIEQIAKVQRKIRELQVRDDFDRKSPQWRDILKLIIENPLTLPFLALPATDTFTAGADSTLTAYSANWTNNSNSHYVLSASDAVRGNGANAENCTRWSADTFNNDQYSQVVYAAASSGSWTGISVRCKTDNTANYYSFYGSSGGTNNGYLGKFVGGSWTQLGSDSGVWTVGRTYRLEAEGTTIRPLENGAVMDPPNTQTDNSHASGAAGLASYNNGANTVDNWEGGNIGGATVHNQSAAGAITPAGGISKQPRKPLSGATSPAGSIVKQTARTLTGAIGPTGVLNAVRTVLVALSGEITPAGELVKRTFNNLGGTIGPAGELTKLTTKAFSGSISPAGTLATILTFLKVISGSIGPAGALIIQTSKGLGGELLPAGSLVKQVATNLAGAITPTGSLSTIKAFFISLSGAITPSGAITASVNKILSGAIEPAGTLTRRIAKSFTGEITPAGSLGTIRVVLLSIAGAIAPGGEVVKRTFKELDGTILPIGQVSKFTSATLAGAITPIGNTTKRIIRILSGALSFLGSVLGIPTATPPSAVRRVELHLTPRTTSLTLQDRSTLLTLQDRSTSLTIQS